MDNISGSSPRPGTEHGSEIPSGEEATARRNRVDAYDKQRAERALATKRIVRARVASGVSSVVIAGVGLAITQVSDLPPIARQTLMFLSIGTMVLALPVLLLLNYLQFGKFAVSQAQAAAIIIDENSQYDLAYARSRAAATEAHGSETTESTAELLKREVAVSVAMDDPTRQLLATRERFQQEIQSLGRRGNLNLVIGIMTTILGVGVLGYVVFAEADADSSDHWRYAAHFIMRLSIALFIQVFAYFFLRLYKAGLEDIRYYQNEMTNMEAKWSALRTANQSNDGTLLKIAVEDLAATERNFRLKRGETTLGLERERMDKNEILDLIREVLGSVRKAK
jgi:hypothetical protein